MLHLKPLDVGMRVDALNTIQANVAVFGTQMQLLTHDISRPDVIWSRGVGEQLGIRALHRTLIASTSSQASEMCMIHCKNLGSWSHPPRAMCIKKKGGTCLADYFLDGI
jgi:hypothetical protein